MAKVLGSMFVCQCCMDVHNHAECCDGGHDREPWCQLWPGQTVTMGLFAEDHGDYCTSEDRELGCDCETITHSMSRCDGCGTTLHGPRFAFVLWSELAQELDLGY